MPKKQLVLIIQARMNSERFPNKVVSDLSGSPLIERILQRVKKVKKIGKIIVATTKKKEERKKRFEQIFHRFVSINFFLIHSFYEIKLQTNIDPIL